MRRLCLDDQVLSNDFLNGVLNQLNWAFSEFVGILQEVNILIYIFTYLHTFVQFFYVFVNVLEIYLPIVSTTNFSLIHDTI